MAKKKNKIKMPSRGVMVAIGIGLVFFIVWFVQFVENRGDKVVEFTQDGEIVETDFRNLEQHEQLGFIEETPTECLDPKAPELLEGPNNWTSEERTINSEASNFNYVRFRSPDYRFGTSVEGRRGIVEGGEIVFIVTCDSDFSSIEELIEYEQTERLLKDSDQIPIVISVSGEEAVQYYLGDAGDPPLVTIFYKDGIKYTLQYHFPRYDGTNQDVIDGLELVRSDYLQRYIEVLGSIAAP